MTSHGMTWHIATNHISSPHVTSQPTTLLHLTPQATSWHQNRSHHHHGTAEGLFTAKKWFGHRAGRSPCAHSIGKFFLFYIVLFPSETSAPGSPGNYLYNNYVLYIAWIYDPIPVPGSQLPGTQQVRRTCGIPYKCWIALRCSEHTVRSSFVHSMRKFRRARYHRTKNEFWQPPHLFLFVLFDFEELSTCNANTSAGLFSGRVVKVAFTQRNQQLQELSRLILSPDAIAARYQLFGDKLCQILLHVVLSRWWSNWAIDNETEHSFSKYV